MIAKKQKIKMLIKNKTIIVTRKKMNLMEKKFKMKKKEVNRVFKEA